MKVEALTGQALINMLPDLARLRIGLFREWPYLYDGSLISETNYLQSFRDSKNALVVTATSGGRVIGASTGTPLMENADNFSAAFSCLPIDPKNVFLCAESVVLPAFRGRGLGHQFFDLREAHARALGFALSAFCDVIRPPNHPARPKDHSRLDPFWRARGYAPLTGAIVHFKWTDVGDAVATTKPLQVWIRAL